MSVLKFLFRTVSRALPLLLAPAALAVTFSTQVFEIEIEPPVSVNGEINVSSAGTTLGTCSAVDTSFCIISESVLLGAGLSGGSYTIDLTAVPELDRAHSGWETVLNPDPNLTLAEQSSTPLASGVLTITIDPLSTTPVLVGANFDLVDSDGDGIADSVDNCPATQPETFVNAEGCPQVTLRAAALQPDGSPSQDYSILADENFTLYCDLGVCESGFYYQGDTVTLTTSQSLGQYLVSEWVGVSCAQGNLNQSDCTFVIGEPDSNGVASLSVNLVENPKYANQPPTLYGAALLVAAPEGTSTVGVYPYDTEGDSLALHVDSVDSPIGVFQVTETFPGSFDVAFTSTSPTETGVVSTVLRATDGTGYAATPVVAIVNPVGAAPPTLASSYVYQEADLTGGLSLQLPAATASGSGALTYAVYSAAPQVTFAPIDAATGLFDVQADAGFSGEVFFVYVVTDTATGDAVGATGSVFVRGSTGGVAIACPAGTQAFSVLGDGVPVCQLPLNIESDLTLTSDFYYLISGEVVVGNGYGEIQSDGSVDFPALTDLSGSPEPLLNVTLSIAPGTTIFADTSDVSEGYDFVAPPGLTVTRGSQIQALGTEQAPIRFLRAGPANWRGITLQGFGEHRDCPGSLILCNIPDVDGYGFAGGFQANDSSGVLQYVIIADAGAGVAADNGRKNALTLMSVGSGTQISHVQVVESAGDGLEIRGGSVNMDHLLVEDSTGDALYYEQGYLGQIQFAGLVQGFRSQGLALKGRTSSVSVTPDRISSPLLSNITLVGDGGSNDIAQLLDRGGLYLTNSAFTVTDEFSQANTCVDLEAGVIDFFGDISISSVFFGIEKALFDCAFTGTGSKTSSNLGFSSTQTVDVTFDPDTYAVTNALGFDANTVFSSATLGSRIINSAFFTPTSYVGAVDPAASAPWWTPWAIDIDAPRFQPPLLDSDQDGISDSYDAFPLDIAASQDVDLDGRPDAWNPGFSEADSTSVPALVLDDGVDSDGDGLVDGLDPYPQDPTNPTGTCPSFSTPVSGVGCALPQLIDQDLFLTNSVIWLIEGNTTVGNGNLNLVGAQTVVDSQGLTAPLMSATLTIEEGTELQFANGFDGFAVTRGSAINAIGSAQSPITVIGNGNNSFLLQGFAPAGACNTVGCNFTDAGGGAFGGSDLADSSGSLRYVLFENIAEFPQNSGPALALMGVGSGTELSHIVIDGSGSRGVYISGGAAHIDHLGITGTFGDSLSWNDGYKGSMQFVVIDMGEQQQGDGIFAASNGVDVFASTVPDAQRSVPTLANVTVYNGAAGDWVAYNITNSGLLVFDSVIMRGSISAEPFESCGIGIAGPNLQGLGTWLFAERIIADCQGGPGVGYFSDSGNLPPAANIISTEALLDTRLASLATEATLAQAPDWSARLANLVNAAPAANFDPVSYLGAVDPSTGVAAWWSFAGPSDAIDSDGDGITDNEDLFPADALEAADTDRDGIGNVADLDDDNDDVPDTADAFPFSARLSVDNDQDGVAALIDLNDNDATIGIGTWSEVAAQITDSALQQCLQDYAASLIMPSDIRTLECEGPVETLAGLDALAALEGVRVVAGAPVGIAALENLPLLQGLDLSGNAFRDSSVFSGLTQVRHLYLEQNHLRDISGLSTLVGLRSLDLFGNYVQNAQPLSTMDSLVALNLAMNDLESAAGLDALANLQKLDASGNKLSSVDFVAPLSHLEVIRLDFNPLRNLDGFGANLSPYLKGVSIYGTEVTTLGGNFDHYVNITCPSEAVQVCSLGEVAVIGAQNLVEAEYDSYFEGPVALIDGNWGADFDGDGVIDILDDFVDDPAAAYDFDGDGLPDAFLEGKSEADSTSIPPLSLDPDSDDDGVLNADDMFPFVYSESIDSDGDGVGDNGDFAPTDSAVTAVYIPEALAQVLDVNLRACIESEIGFGTGSAILGNDYLSSDVGLTSPSQITDSLGGFTDYISYQKPVIYSDGLTYLSCRNFDTFGPMDLSGLGVLTYLETLRLSSNAIVDVTPLSSLRRLSDLNLRNNQIVDLSPLESLTLMIDLTLWENPIVNVDALAGMTRLVYLDLDETRVDSVASLSGLANLREIYLSGAITSLNGAQGWESLEWGYFYGNKLTDISALSNSPLLVELVLENNLLTDISSLSSLTALEYLNLSYNQINDISGLANLSELSELNVDNNRVRTLDPIANLANMRWLYAANNKLTALPDLTSLTSLYDLDVSFNKILKLDGLNPQSALRYANFDRNEIQKISGFVADYSAQGGLNLSLYVSDNPLSCEDEILATSSEVVTIFSDICFDDSDGDGVVDIYDAFPDTDVAATDTDGDGLPDVLLAATDQFPSDKDDDNDGVLDVDDAFPLDPTEWLDTDGDGVGDNKDADPADASVQFFSIDSALAGVQDAGLSACVGSLEQAPQTTDAITSLYCAEPITSLAGLDKFPYLERLQVVSETGSGATDLSVLSSLPDLKTLGLSGDFADLSPLGNLAKLETLDLLFTGGASHDLSALGSLTALKSLYMQNVDASGWQFLSNLSALEKLSLPDANIASLSELPLASMTSLTDLNLSLNPLSSLSGLNAASSLTRLNIDQSQVSNLADLSGLSALESLSIAGIPAQDFSVLADLVSLRSLHAPDTALTDLSVIAGLSQLEKINIDRTGATTLSALSTLANVTFMSAAGNGLTDLQGLENMTRLEGLIVSDNALTTIDGIAALDWLKFLNISNNQITSIAPLIHSSGEGGTYDLVYLFADGNQLTDVSVLGDLFNLEFVSLNNNQVISLGALAGKYALEYVAARNNNVSNIPSLSASELTGTTTVDLSGNPIACDSLFGYTPNLGVKLIFEGDCLDSTPARVGVKAGADIPSVKGALPVSQGDKLPSSSGLMDESAKLMLDVNNNDSDAIELSVPALSSRVKEDFTRSLRLTRYKSVDAVETVNAIYDDVSFEMLSSDPIENAVADPKTEPVKSANLKGFSVQSSPTPTLGRSGQEINTIETPVSRNAVLLPQPKRVNQRGVRGIPAVRQSSFDTPVALKPKPRIEGDFFSVLRFDADMPGDADRTETLQVLEAAQ